MNMMDTNLIVGIVSAAFALIGGGGGIFAFMTSRQKNNLDEHSSSVSEWQALYEEMKKRLDDQEKDNKELRAQVLKLREELSRLTIELNNYKKYDSYIKDLESYGDYLLSAIKPLISEDAYNSLANKRPQNVINQMDEEDSK